MSECKFAEYKNLYEKFYNESWTIYGYYGGIKNPQTAKAVHDYVYTWYQVDDFGNMFEPTYPDRYDSYNHY